MTDDATLESGWYLLEHTSGGMDCRYRTASGYWHYPGQDSRKDLWPGRHIIARVDDLLRDAERYRYVRDELSPEDFAIIDATELDAFIDAEIARAQARGRLDEH